MLDGFTLLGHGRTHDRPGVALRGSLLNQNPGQRGEHIAAGLGTGSKAIRLATKRLIEAGHVRTKGERRAMQYWAG